MFKNMTINATLKPKVWYGVLPRVWIPSQTPAARWFEQNMLESSHDLLPPFLRDNRIRFRKTAAPRPILWWAKLVVTTKKMHEVLDTLGDNFWNDFYLNFARLSSAVHSRGHVDTVSPNVVKRFTRTNYTSHHLAMRNTYTIRPENWIIIHFR